MNSYRKRLLKSVAIFLLLTVIPSACKESSDLRSPKGKIVGTVNGDNLTVPQVDYSAGQLRAEVTPSNLPKILDRMVSVSLMAQEAIRRGMLKEDRVVSGLAWLERMYLASELAEKIAGEIQLSPADLFNYFQQHKEEFGTGLKLQLMVLPESIYAEQTIAELKSGADFVKLARERSMDTSTITIPGYPTRGVGMSLGWSLKDEETVFSLKPGEISPVLSTILGYQIVRVVEKKAINANPTMNEITQLYISEALKEQRRREKLDSLLATLRQQAKVVLKPEEYPSGK